MNHLPVAGLFFNQVTNADSWSAFIEAILFYAN